MHLRSSKDYFEWFWIFGLHFLQINIVFCFNSSNDNIDAWKKLNEPKYIVAPMVDLSDLAWRILCRRHGAQLCYTEMLFSKLFAASRKYRKKQVLDCPEDKPLIVQFCGNDPKILLEAVLKLDTKVDGVDINLGCPQMCAKRSKYGAFLQDDWKLISRMVKILHENVNIPVSCKIRVFPEIGKSIDYARMLEDSGCQLLTVHGRTREQIRENSGLASWKHIKAIRQSVNIPLFANGNIRCLNDIHRCLQETGCNGVMSAEGILHNPALFEGSNCTVWEAALEYMELVELYTTPLTSIRGHLFKLFVHLFTVPENSILRTKLGQAFRQKDFVDIILKIKERYEPIHNSKHFQENEHFKKIECHPPWICHSYTRHSSKNQSQFFHEMINPKKERRNKRKISV